MAVLNVKLIIELNFKAIALRSILSSTISGIVGIVLAYMSFGVWSLVYQAITLSSVNLIFVWIYCKWWPKLAFSCESFRELFSFGSKLMLAGLLNTVYAHLTPMAIGKFYTPKDLGYYNQGAEFARLPNEVCQNVLERVTFPIFSRIQNDTKHLLDVYKKYIQITSLCLIFFSMLLASLAKPVVLLLLTEKWSESIIYLQLFCFAVMFNHINTINLSLLKVNGRSDLFLKLEVIKKSVATLILFCAIPFGVLAICISKIIYDQVAIVINTYYSGKLFKMGYLSQFKDFIGYFFSSLFACLPALLITFTNLPNILQLIAGVLLSLVVYYLILRKDSMMIELVELIKGSIQKVLKKK